MRLVVDEEEAELHAGEGLVRAHRQVGEVNGVDLDPELVCPVNEIGEGLEAALVAAQAYQLMAAALFVETGGQRDPGRRRDRYGGKASETTGSVEHSVPRWPSSSSRMGDGRDACTAWAIRSMNCWKLCANCDTSSP